MTTYICRKLMQVVSQETGEVEWREPGQEVPEAATWPHLLSYIHLGQIEVVNPEPVVYPTSRTEMVEDVERDSSAGERRRRRRTEESAAKERELHELRETMRAQADALITSGGAPEGED